MIRHFPPTMTHEKIPPLSNAVRVGNLLFVSGTPGYDAAMRLDPSFTIQFEVALNALRAILSQVGTTIPDGQLKLPHLWSRKFPHPVQQD